MDKREILGINPKQVVGFAFAVFLVISGSLIFFQLLKSSLTSDLMHSLQTAIETTHSAINLWESNQRSMVTSFATQPDIRRHAQTLLRVPQDRESLLASPAQNGLRNHFRNYLERHGYKGFFIIAPNGVSLASSRNSNVGINNPLVEQPNLLKRMWAGHSVISRIMQSDVPYQKNVAQQNAVQPTLFVGAPIHDTGGKIIALLTLRIDPSDNLFLLTRQGGLGETGETYLFSPSGRLLTESRFESELVQAGFLSEGVGSSLHIYLKDPGGDILKKSIRPIDLEQRPLTLMAENAIHKRDGENSEGYRGYRGVPVVGTWRWIPELNLGLATEQEASEAYKTLREVRLAIFGATLMVVFVLTGTVWVFLTGRRDLTNSERHLDAIVTTALDGIVVIDQFGIIQSANPAMTKIFGYDPLDLIGNNVSLLMPPPYRGEHNGYLSRYMETHQAKIIGIGREVTALRRDGSTFTADLTVSEIVLGPQRFFAGIIRDISERKAAEAELDIERHFFREILDSLNPEIAVCDKAGQLIYANQAWKSFSEPSKGNARQNEDQDDGLTATEAAIEARLMKTQFEKLIAGDIEDFTLEYSRAVDKSEHWYVAKGKRFSHRNKPHMVISHTDVTERKRYEQEVLREKELAVKYLNVIGVILVVLSRSGRVSMINRMGCKILGYKEAEILGFDWFENFLPNEWIVLARNRFNQLLAGEAEGESFEIPVLNCSGEQRLILWNNIALRDKNGGITGILSSGENITERRQAEKKLEKANAELRMMALVAKKTDNAVVVTDTEGHIKWVNHGFTIMTGYSLEEVQGEKPGRLLQGPETDPETALKISRAVKRRERVEVEILNYHKSGKPYWLHLEITPITNDQGEVVEYIALERDITEKRQAAQELIKAKRVAEEANIAKSDFLAAMSHEIRTPMNGVIGMIDLLKTTSLEEKQRDLVKTAQDSAVTLLSIIDSILDFSKIEAGRLELEQTPVLLEEVLEGVADTLLPIADKKGIELMISYDPEVPAVKADPVRLRQILFNLGGNAIKFTNPDRVPVGRVELRVDYTGALADKVNVDLIVKDNGIGMSEKVQAKLFHPFVQAESSTTRRFGGTGLGLVISQRLTELMGGEIILESQEGQGSTFTVRLSLPIVPGARNASTEKLDGLKILLIEPCDPVLKDILVNYLKNAGSEVSITNKEEAVRRLQDTDGSTDTVVVIDSSQNRTSVESFQQQVRACAGNMPKGFVQLSKGQRRKARQIATDCFDIDINAMRRSCFLEATAAAAGRVSLKQAEHKTETNSPFEPISLEKAEAAGRLVLVVEDNETNQKVIMYQLDLMGVAGEIAKNGLEGLEMWRSGRYHLVLTDCHMPKMDGYQLAESIRWEESGNKHIPIIAITADALKGTAERCLSSGMDDYLSKPIKMDLLKRKLKYWLPDLESLNATDEKNQEPIKQGHGLAEPTIDADQESVEPGALAEILGTDAPEMLESFYLDFLSSAAVYLDELLAAEVAGDVAEVGALAHKMKSSARAVGANRLADCCQMLESAAKGKDSDVIKDSIIRLPILFAGVREWIEERYQSMMTPDTSE